MYQQPPFPPQEPWQPQEPQSKQGTFSQLQWQQQPSYYSQPTPGFGPPPQPPRPQPYLKLRRFFKSKLGIGCLIVVFGSLACTIIRDSHSQ